MQKNYSGSHGNRNYSNTYYKEVSPNKQSQYNNHNKQQNLETNYYFPGAASLLDHLDRMNISFFFSISFFQTMHVEKIFLMLRDGKKLIGILRSFDQFGFYSTILLANYLIYFFQANLVLESTIERIVVGRKFGDLPLGLYIVRGENVILMGEVVCYSCYFIL